MKIALKKLYFALAKPLYARLSREVVLQNQLLLAELAASEEKFSKMYGRELVLLTAKVQHLEESLASLQMNGIATEAPLSGPPDLIDRHIADVVGMLEKSGDLISASKQLDLSVSDVLHFEKKYRGMNLQGIHRARLLEKENALLKQTVADLKK